MLSTNGGMMAASRDDEPTIGSFIRSDIPEEGDIARVQFGSDVYTIENKGIVFPGILKK